MEKYNFIRLLDNYDYELYGIIALNKKNKIEDFEKEWQKVRDNLYKERQNGTYDDDDLSYITNNISSEFDWFIINCNSDIELEF